MIYSNISWHSFNFIRRQNPELNMPYFPKSHRGLRLLRHAACCFSFQKKKDRNAGARVRNVTSLSHYQWQVCSSFLFVFPSMLKFHTSILFSCCFCWLDSQRINCKDDLVANSWKKTIEKLVKIRWIFSCPPRRPFSYQTFLRKKTLNLSKYISRLTSWDEV